MIERCEDPKCKGFGKELVDREYGYPVCPSNTGPLNPEDRKPMDPRYEMQYDKE